MTAREKIHQYIERASKTELLFLIAYITANKRTMIKEIGRPEFTNWSDCKRIIKRMREAQNDHPEEHETLEAAIQFIRQEWLQKEAQA